MPEAFSSFTYEAPNSSKYFIAISSRHHFDISIEAILPGREGRVDSTIHARYIIRYYASLNYIAQALYDFVIRFRLYFSYRILYY